MFHQKLQNGWRLGRAVAKDVGSQGKTFILNALFPISEYEAPTEPLNSYGRSSRI